MKETISECAQNLRNLGLFERAGRLVRAAEDGPVVLELAINAALAILRDLTYFAVHKDNGCSEYARQTVSSTFACLTKVRSLLESRVGAQKEDALLSLDTAEGEYSKLRSKPESKGTTPDGQ